MPTDPIDTPGYTDGWNAAHYALWQWRPGDHDGACECPECVTVRKVIAAVLDYQPEQEDPDDDHHPGGDRPRYAPDHG